MATTIKIKNAILSFKSMKEVFNKVGGWANNVKYDLNQAIPSGTKIKITISGVDSSIDDKGVTIYFVDSDGNNVQLINTNGSSLFKISELKAGYEGVITSTSGSNIIKYFHFFGNQVTSTDYANMTMVIKADL